MTGIDYGFESTNEVEYDRPGFPVGEYRVRVTDEEGVASGVKVTYKILTGERKGQNATVWYNTKSDNPTTQKIAKQDLKRIGDATGKPVDKDNGLQGRIFCVDVTVNAKNEQFTNAKYYPADHIDEVSATETKDAF